MGLPGLNMYVKQGIKFLAQGQNAVTTGGKTRTNNPSIPSIIFYQCSIMLYRDFVLHKVLLIYKDQVEYLMYYSPLQVVV